MYPGQQPPPQQPWQQPPQYPPQYPQYPQPPQPYPTYNIHEVHFTDHTNTIEYNLDYTSRAWQAFWLYWAGYVPGLVMSIVYLSQARRTQQETGQTVYGYGCLWTSLIIGLIPVALVLLSMFFIFAAIALSGHP